MKMDGRRQSSNVVDGRGGGGAVKAGGIGLGGILIAVVIYFLTGRAPDPSMFGSFVWIMLIRPSVEHTPMSQAG